MSNTEYIAGEMDVEITSSEFQLSYLDSYLNDGATFIALNLVPIEAFDNFYTWTTFSQFEANLQSASIRYENSSVITYITFRNQVIPYVNFIFIVYCRIANLLLTFRNGSRVSKWDLIVLLAQSEMYFAHFVLKSIINLFRINLNHSVLGHHL